MFRVKLLDMLTGYRVMSRRFVKSFPFTAEGFGIETELTVHAVRLMMPFAEVDTPYKERPVGSVSKLNTYRDGFKILFTIGGLVREERPMVFFTGIFCRAGGGSRCSSAFPSSPNTSAPALFRACRVQCLLPG